MADAARIGQKTLYGKDKAAVIKTAQAYEREANEHRAVGDPMELVSRAQESAAWWRRQAERMADA